MKRSDLVVDHWGRWCNTTVAKHPGIRHLSGERQKNQGTYLVRQKSGAWAGHIRCSSPGVGPSAELLSSRLDPEEKRGSGSGLASDEHPNKSVD